MIADSSQTLFIQQVEALRKAYADHLVRVAFDMDSFIARLDQPGVDTTFLAQLRKIAHGLVGSGATYGFEAVSERARLLEQYLQSVEYSGASLTVPQSELLRVLISNLRSSLIQ